MLLAALGAGAALMMTSDASTTNWQPRVAITHSSVDSGLASSERWSIRSSVGQTAVDTAEGSRYQIHQGLLVPAFTLVVRSLEDVLTDGCEEHCTLRDAITIANKTPEPAVISFAGSVFNTPDGTSGPVITLKAPLPAITGSVSINGRIGTSTNYESPPQLVTLDGSMFERHRDTPGLLIEDGTVIIQGLNIRSFPGDGILVNGGSDHIFSGNIIGADSTSSGSHSNGANGIAINSVTGVRIGGTDPDSSNFIGGNAASGVLVTGSSGIKITGNKIGVDLGNDEAISNREGIILLETSFGTITDNIVRSNIEHGITVTGVSNLIERNAIYGNGGNGIRILGSSSQGNEVLNNAIGFDPDSFEVAGNGLNGIYVEDANGNLIGESDLGNTIVASGDDGVLLEGTLALDNQVQSNRIGYIQGQEIIPLLQNRGNGITVSGSDDNTIGPGNTIINNRGNGIQLRSVSSSSSIDEGADGNDIYGNTVGSGESGNEQNGILVTRSNGNNIGVAGLPSNVILGNSLSGIAVEQNSHANSLNSNFIGVDDTGGEVASNGAVGIRVSDSSGTTIGQSTGGNTVIGHGSTNILVSDSDDTSVTGNDIGILIDTQQSLPNPGDGISIDNSSDTSVLENRIGGHEGVAVRQSGNSSIDTLVQHNQIGATYIDDDCLSPDCLNNYGNQTGAISLEGGRGSVVTLNTFAFNGGTATVAVTGSGSLEHTVERNYFAWNEGLNVDLGRDGRTPNDHGDLDSGPNQLQNHPEIDSVTLDLVQGTFTTESNETKSVRVDVYSTGSHDESPRHNVIGFIGSTVVATPEAGEHEFSIDLEPSIEPGLMISVQLTTSDGNSSEISELHEVLYEDAEVISTRDHFALGSGLRSMFSIGMRGPDTSVQFRVSSSSPGSVELLDQAAGDQVTDRLTLSPSQDRPLNVIGIDETATPAVFDFDARGFDAKRVTVDVVTPGLKLKISDGGLNSIVSTGAIQPSGEFEIQPVDSQPVKVQIASESPRFALIKVGGLMGPALDVTVPEGESVAGFGVVSQDLGSTAIRASASGYIPDTSLFSALGIITGSISEPILGSGLQTELQVTLSSPQPEPISLSLNSVDRGLGFREPGASQLPATALTIAIPAGESSVVVEVHSLTLNGASTSEDVALSAPGFKASLLRIPLVRPSLKIHGLEETLHLPDQTVPFSVLWFVEASSGAVFRQPIARTENSPLLNVVSGLQSVAKLKTDGDSSRIAQHRFEGGELEAEFELIPEASGQVRISASAPGFVGTHLDIRISMPRIYLTTYPVGSGLMETQYGKLNRRDHSGVTVSITSLSPDALKLSANETGPADSIVEIFVPAGTIDFHFVAHATLGSAGEITIEARAVEGDTAIESATEAVEVVGPQYEFSQFWNEIDLCRGLWRWWWCDEEPVRWQINDTEFNVVVGIMTGGRFVVQRVSSTGQPHTFELTAVNATINHSLLFPIQVSIPPGESSSASLRLQPLCGIVQLTALHPELPDWLVEPSVSPEVQAKRCP